MNPLTICDYPFNTGGIVFDSVLGKEVLEKLAFAYKQGQQGLGNLLPPEQIFRPDNFTLLPEAEIACWLWFQGFSQRSGKQASDILGNLYRVLVDNPCLTRLSELTDSEIPAMQEEIRNVEPFASSLVQIHRNRVTWWAEMWRLLRDSYDGDPRKYFKAHEDLSLSIWEQREVYIEAMRKDLKGVQHKVAQLMIVFFQDYHRQYGWREDVDFWDRFAKIPACPIDIPYAHGDENQNCHPLRKRLPGKNSQADL